MPQARQDAARPARQRLLDVLVTITAERGLEGVSIREVANAAGVSIGTVQYYCRSKDEMLRMTFEEVNQRILGRVSAVAKAGLVGDVLRRAVLEFLPLDDRRRIEAAVYLAFTARSAVSADLAAVRHTMISEQHQWCSDAFRLGQDRGEGVGEFEPDRAAYATVAVVDGLLMNLLSDPSGLTTDEAVAVLDDHLCRYLRLTGGPSALRHEGAPGPSRSECLQDAQSVESRLACAARQHVEGRR